MIKSSAWRSLVLIAILQIGTFSISKAGVKPVIFRLGESPELVNLYTGLVQISIQYADGHVFSSVLFNREELRAGVTEKTIYVDFDREISKCSVNWGIMNRPPGGNPQEKPKLIVPQAIVHTGLLTHCDIPENAQSIALSIAPYHFRAINIALEPNSLAKRDAHLLQVDLKVNSNQDQYFPPTNSFLIEGNLDNRDIFRTYLIFHEAPMFAVKTLWILNSGAPIADLLTTDQFEIELK